MSSVQNGKLAPAAIAGFLLLVAASTLPSTAHGGQTSREDGTRTVSDLNLVSRASLAARWILGPQAFKDIVPLYGYEFMDVCPLLPDYSRQPSRSVAHALTTQKQPNLSEPAAVSGNLSKLMKRRLMRLGGNVKTSPAGDGLPMPRADTKKLHDDPEKKLLMLSRDVKQLDGASNASKRLVEERLLKRSDEPKKLLVGLKRSGGTKGLPAEERARLLKLSERLTELWERRLKLSDDTNHMAAVRQELLKKKSGEGAKWNARTLWKSYDAPAGAAASSVEELIGSGGPIALVTAKFNDPTVWTAQDIDGGKLISLCNERSRPDTGAFVATEYPVNRLNVARIFLQD